MTPEQMAVARDLLVSEHRKVVSEWSGNFGGHIGVREGWVEYDDETEIEDCEVCRFLTRSMTVEVDVAAIAKGWHPASEPLPNNVSVEVEFDKAVTDLVPGESAKAVRWRVTETKTPWDRVVAATDKHNIERIGGWWSEDYKSLGVTCSCGEEFIENWEFTDHIRRITFDAAKDR